MFERYAGEGKSRIGGTEAGRCWALPACCRAAGILIVILCHFELVFFARFLVMSHTPHMYLFDIVKEIPGSKNELINLAKMDSQNVFGVAPDER